MQESIYKIEWSLFIAMCENASLQEAAEAYGLSASAASRALRRLEDSLGANLFDRTCKPMVLTPEGKALYRKIKPAHVITKDALEAFKESNAKHPDLKIGFLDSFSLSVVPKFIERVKSSASSITCLTGSSDRLLERLAKREVDVILSSDPSLENSEYRRLLLIREPSMRSFLEVSSSTVQHRVGIIYCSAISRLSIRTGKAEEANCCIASFSRLGLL